jgi:4-hydroxy-tetrahydrodipicolinate synthase
MFTGVYTAMITPFKEDGSIDEVALRNLVNTQIDAGIAGLVPVGTTGESPTVTHSENLKVVQIVIEEARGRVPVIAGTGSNSTAEAIEMTRQAKSLGATASLQVAPYYNKPTQEGLYQHYMKIADAVDLHMVVYNIAGRTAVNIETATLNRLAKHPLVVAVKEASGNVLQMMDVIASTPEGFDVLSGDDNLAFTLTALGGNGLISVASNLMPQRMVAMVDAVLQGDVARGRAEHYALLPWFRALFLETNPIPIKHMMHRAGLCELAYRLPMTPLSAAHQTQVDELLMTYGIGK